MTVYSTHVKKENETKVQRMFSAILAGLFKLGNFAVSFMHKDDNVYLEEFLFVCFDNFFKHKMSYSAL